MSIMPEELRGQAAGLVESFADKGKVIATAESCTGGMIAAGLTDIAGASSVLDRGFVTYSNAAKTEMIGVPTALIEAHGAVSEAVARAMAEGALAASRADVALSVTGIAGPGGGSVAKPVGLVHLALASRRGTTHRMERFGDVGRAEVRLQTVALAYAMLGEWLAAQEPAATGP
ncbi:CinA family protein [Aureimonas glaciei]|uniref:Competence damage-inducible protein A n=1 Tax=Aureimonas glaciei TaxID=1776957 RepID=A0A916Y0F6_9HYPH|nr:competence damage-inducible protein A [Aureimonas glaciei]